MDGKKNCCKVTRSKKRGMDLTIKKIKAFTTFDLFFYNHVRSSMWDLKCYVTPTEWDWMHNKKSTTCIKELALGRPLVYAYVCKYTPSQNNHARALTSRGSLSTLKTSDARIAIIQQATRYFGADLGIDRCMLRPLGIVQYYVRLLVGVVLFKSEVLGKVWTGAICAGRRDVLEWMCLNFPVFVAFNIGRDNIFVKAVYCKQVQTMRWVCKKYKIPLECDESVSLAAVETNQLKVLQWLRRGPLKCPWNRLKCLEEAQKRGYTRIAAWIRRQPI